MDVMRLLIGRELALRNAVPESEANRIGLIGTLLPNSGLGIIVVNELAKREAERQPASQTPTPAPEDDGASLKATLDEFRRRSLRESLRGAMDDVRAVAAD